MGCPLIALIIFFLSICFMFIRLQKTYKTLPWSSFTKYIMELNLFLGLREMQ
jgi:hypothetical protein